MAHQANALAMPELLINQKDKLCAFSETVPVSEDYIPKDKNWKKTSKINDIEVNNINFSQICEENGYIFVKEEQKMIKGFTDKIIVAVFVGLLVLVLLLILSVNKCRKGREKLIK